MGDQALKKPRQKRYQGTNGRLFRGHKPGLLRDPQSKLEIEFCERWLTAKDHTVVADQMGISRVRGLRWRRKFTGYLVKQIDRLAVEVTKKIAYDATDVLQAMAAVSFCNPLDFLVRKEGNKWRWKRMEELTFQQATLVHSVEVTEDGRVNYKLPTAKMKFINQQALGKNLGLFDDKLIQEFRHKHLHTHLEFKAVSTDKMQQLEQLLLEALGPEAQRLLGIQQEEPIQASEN